MLSVSYIKDGLLIKTGSSNSDIEISEKEESGRYTVTVKAIEDITLECGQTVYNTKINDGDLYFLNGYQSWTDTKEFYLSEKEKNIKKSPKFVVDMFAMDKYGDSNFYEYSKNKLHGYDVFYSKGSCESFIYSLNYEKAYLIFEIDKKEKTLSLISDIKGLELKQGEEFTVFDFRHYNSYKEGIESFNLHFTSRQYEKVFGYTSWYNYYQNINEKIITRDLDALDSKFNLFQIDDGYETFVGDWLDVDKTKFPNGLKPIVKKIHEKGFKAGIWLAPFSVEEKSSVFANHKDWIKKDENGNLVKTGGNWSGFYPLDLDNEEAVSYIRKSLEYYMELGFDFFKLDFLYCASYLPYRGKTRCMVQNDSYNLLRDILKDRLILGCGANTLNSYGKFEYLRIGPDVSLEFDDVFYMRPFHRERISTKNTLQNTIYRSIFNGHLFGCDPDVFLLREENIKLNKKQKLSLITINSLFGSVLMTSDNVGEYNGEAKRLLENSLDIFFNAKEKEFRRDKEFICISYVLDGKKHELKYNTKKGELI